jgi:hypothetical protein
MPSARCISRMLAAIVIMSGGALATPAAAQQPEATGWQFTFIPYVWASAFQGRIGVGPAVTDVDLSFGDIIDHADFALMASSKSARSDGSACSTASTWGCPPIRPPRSRRAPPYDSTRIR